MNEFENALLQATSEDFSDVPDESELDIAPIKVKKLGKSHILRRTLIIAAAITVLAGSTLAAYVLAHKIGNVDVETDEYQMFGMYIDDDNRYYELIFDERLVSANAPERIETYFLPTAISNAENLNAPSCVISQHNFMSYRPYKYAVADADHGTYLPSIIICNDATAPDDIAKILAAPTEVQYAWYVNGHTISFTQYLAKIAADGTSLIHHVVQDADTITTAHRTLEVDGYEVFSFEEDFSKHSEWLNDSGGIVRHWYWSDGNYLFSLRASMPEAEMIELFRSVSAVSERFPYRLTENNSVTEDFALLE